LALLLLLGPALSLADTPAEESSSVFPQRLSARDLLYACNSSAMTQVGRERRQYCTGFVSGVEEAVRLLEARRGRRTVCLPADVSSRRLADSYTRYARQHASILSKPAAEVALEALTELYACRDADLR
jgi:hypothetical protein